MIFGVINKYGNNVYKLSMCSWNAVNRQIETKGLLGTLKQTVSAVKKLDCILINSTVTKKDAFYFRKYADLIDCVKSVAIIVRKHFVMQYGSGTNLCGHCIEASETLQTILKLMGINSYTVEGWCEFDDEYYGSDRPYDPHTWLELAGKPGRQLYVDITADQFNPGMYAENKYPEIIIKMGLPHGMSYDEPVVYDD